jgi:predicted  nucleic acid-binding Zn-ribbon protein
MTTYDVAALRDELDQAFDRISKLEAELTEARKAIRRLDRRIDEEFGDSEFEVTEVDD